MDQKKKILIIGANGKVGKLLTEKLKDSDAFEPTAMLRKESQKDYFSDRGLSSIVADLEGGVKELTEAFRPFDGIVFAAGSGGKTGEDKTMSVDLDGAAKAVEAAEKAGAKRFVMVSASHADDRSFWEKSGIKTYYIAKHYADEMLRHSKLDYTILRPVKLTDDEGGGEITAETNAEKVKEEIARADVAETIVHVLSNNDTIGKTIEISEGGKKIKKALEVMA